MTTHLRDDELIGLSVETTTSENIGRVAGFVFDAESGVVVQYRIRPPGVIAALLESREFLIHHTQVVSVDRQRMIVQSGAVGSSGRRQRRAFVPLERPQPATSSTES